jgi:hypothetical protein
LLGATRNTRAQHHGRCRSFLLCEQRDKHENNLLSQGEIHGVSKDVYTFYIITLASVYTFFGTLCFMHRIYKKNCKEDHSRTHEKLQNKIIKLDCL